MRALRLKGGIVFGSVVLAVALSASIVAAQVTSTVLADTNTVRLRIVRTEATGGFDSNWHTHQGPAIVQVQEGRFKIFQESCEPKVVGPGETYIEIPGVPVRAVAKGDITWTTTLVLPNSAPGDPMAAPASDPCS
ncbi:MAG: cupin domain-containing protein [Actinomycetota bacterium]